MERVGIFEAWGEGKQQGGNRNGQVLRRVPPTERVTGAAVV